MLTEVCQRWRYWRGTYRPKGEPINPRSYDVAVMPYAEAKAFVAAHHYSGRMASSIFRVGLYRRHELVGVASFGNGPSQQSMDIALPYPDVRRADLARFVLLDDVPANGETWFLAQVFRLARGEGFEAFVAYSDPEPRVDLRGQVVFPGHVGTIYQAHNAVYTGRTDTRTKYLFADGSILTDAELSKLRAKKQGWQYVMERLLSHGARPLRKKEDWVDWCAQARISTTRRWRHRGTHRYLWALDRVLQKQFPESQTYPKFDLKVM